MLIKPYLEHLELLTVKKKLVKDTSKPLALASNG